MVDKKRIEREGSKLKVNIKYENRRIELIPENDKERSIFHPISTISNISYSYDLGKEGNKSGMVISFNKKEQISTNI